MAEVQLSTTVKKPRALADLPPGAGEGYLRDTVEKVVDAVKARVELRIDQLDKELEVLTRGLDPAGLTQPVLQWTLNLHLTELGQSLQAQPAPAADQVIDVDAEVIETKEQP